MRCLSARGSPMERAFPVGMMRQLFEPVLAAGPAEQGEMFAGSAGRVQRLLAARAARRPTVAGRRWDAIGARNPDLAPWRAHLAQALLLAGQRKEARALADEHAALARTWGAPTRIADAAARVTDEAWANAAKYYDTDQLAALVTTIAVINADNRFNVVLKNQGGDYQPGQWA
jgi:alkylhydroperoxidase family enzyme